MGDIGGLNSHLTSSSFGRDVKLGVPCLNAACTVGLNHISVARNPVKLTQNKVRNEKQTKNAKSKFSRMRSKFFGTHCIIRAYENVNTCIQWPLLVVSLYHIHHYDIALCPVASQGNKPSCFRPMKNCQ